MNPEARATGYKDPNARLEIRLFSISTSFEFNIYVPLLKHSRTITMAPPSAIEPQNGSETKPSNVAPLEPGLNEKESKMKAITFPSPPKFDDPYKERAYLKGRLAAAFRIFGKYGYDEGVAGHITLRVSPPILALSRLCPDI